MIIGIETGIEDAQAINCGHISPYVMHEGTITKPSLDSGVPLGLAELASEPTTVGWFRFPHGATLLLSTDGLTETRAPDGTFYPVDERLKKLDPSPTDLPQALFEDSLAFAGQGGRHDDVAVLTVRWSPAR
ncbi:serine phosphatase RsbU (regulator of sigma subunit) [Streptomyces umbrinus]|uniref:Serine phosphatase RsbU (Regulator of sigma subunit) n=1 Tax=Streptomyces umbrinus TaxID=67370 RepID=A0ABU0TAQ4_9ACTN|nr:serine phosphatase RsbU (regulator of sigma subunit) [Streptomyces umbrinus]